jgi:hypothetical protein
MSKVLLAEFAHLRRLRDAASQAHQRGYCLLDALAPFPVEDVAAALDGQPSKVRVYMFLGGILVAAAALATEYVSAVIAYPYNAGGRPLNAWPAFMLVPFAVGILGASIAGFIRFLCETGLPRLHHPLFTLAAIKHATQDRFFLAIAAPPTDEEMRAAKEELRSMGATEVYEVDS